jgi:hypothetical protein
MMKHYVVIKEFGTDKEIKRMGPMDKRSADKVDDGANINLNHDLYYTLVEEAE